MENTPANQPQPEITARPIFVPKDWLVVSILAVVVAFLWIGFGVYNTLNASTIPAPQQKRLTLFSTDLDENVISELGKKKQILNQTIDENARVMFVREGESMGTPNSQ